MEQRQRMGTTFGTARRTLIISLPLVLLSTKIHIIEHRCKLHANKQQANHHSHCDTSQEHLHCISNCLYLRIRRGWNWKNYKILEERIKKIVHKKGFFRSIRPTECKQFDQNWIWSVGWHSATVWDKRNRVLQMLFWIYVTRGGNWRRWRKTILYWLGNIGIWKEIVEREWNSLHKIVEIINSGLSIRVAHTLLTYLEN